MKEREKLLFSCRDLWIGYDNKPVIQNLTLDIFEGDYITVIGENGVGKSTFIKTILGLLPPVSGKIKGLEDMKGEIGYLPQQTQVQRDFPASVYEVVISGFLNKVKNRPFYTQSEKKKAIEIMEVLQVSKLKGYCYRELSGGQQQRVLLARAMCAANQLLVLDEPVTGLDPNASKELYANLKILNQEKKMTIIMISHDLVNAVKEADKVLSLKKDSYSYELSADYEGGGIK